MPRISPSILKVVLLIGVILFCSIVGYWLQMNGYLSVDAIRSQLDRAGVFGPILFMLVYAIATGLFLPGTPFTLAGGALFGPVLGSLYVVIGATLGAILGFWIARLFAGEAIERWLVKKMPTLHSYSEQLEKRGFITVFILRLIPIFPFAPLNYALGVTHVRFWPYAAATLIGIAPLTFAYATFGNSLTSGNPWFIIGGVGLVVVSGFVIARLKKRYSPPAV